MLKLKMDLYPFRGAFSSHKYVGINEINGEYTDASFCAEQFEEMLGLDVPKLKPNEHLVLEMEAKITRWEIVDDA